MWGHDDLLIPPELGTLFQKVIPGAELVVFDQCGHVPQIEKPMEFNKALLDFLTKP